jgi:molybdate transport system permease protein
MAADRGGSRSARERLRTWLLLGAAALLAAWILVPLLSLLASATPLAFQRGLANPAALPALQASLWSGAVSLLVIVGLGTPLAWTLAHARGWFARFVELLVLLPLVLPPAVAGVALLLAFGRRGLVGGLLPETWTIAFTPAALVGAQVFVAAPLFVQPAIAALRRLEPEPLAAARSLGATPWLVATRVALPMAWRGLAAGAALALARALGEFGATLMFAGNLTGSTQTLPLAVYTVWHSDAEAAQALAIVLLGLSAGLLLLVVGVGQLVRGSRPASVAVTAPFAPSLEAPPSPAAAATSEPARDAQAALTVDITLVRYGLRVRAELQAAAGAPLVLAGPNGAGKSTLLRAIAGLEPATKGSVKLGGRTLLDTRLGVELPARDRRLGYVPQGYGLFPTMTALQHLEFALACAGVPRALRRERARVLADEHGLTSLAHRRPTELSGGERQRLAIARALATEPQALLLDEPTAALDVLARRALLERLAATLARTQVPVVVVVHEPSHARALGTTLAVMDAGVVFPAGAWDELRRAPPTPFAQAFIAEPDAAVLSPRASR